MSGFDDEFPEHAKLNPHVDANWEIRNFLEYLAGRSIFLARYNPVRHAIEGLGELIPEALLLEWRGVDVATYRAESQVLDKRYGTSRTVEQLLAQRGPGRPPIMTDEKLAEAKKLIGHGAGVAWAAEVIGVSRATLYRHLSLASEAVEPEPTKESETPVPDPAQDLLDKIRSARK